MRVSRSVATGFREHHQERVRTCPGCRRIMAFSDNTRVAKKSDLAGLWEPGGRRSYFRANSEAENPAGEQYSAERLSKTVSLHLHQSASQLVETIYTSVSNFVKQPL